MEALSDEELIARYRSQSDSPDAELWLNELFQRHRQKVAVWCLRMTGDRESAADLAQDVFVKAFRRLESYRGGSRFSTWLYSIARNHCYNEIKARSSAPELLTDPVLRDFVDGGASPYSQLERKSSARVVRELVQSSLTETESQVFLLHCVEDLPLDSITRLLKLENTSGAKAYMVSARRKLARAVEKWRSKEQRARP